VDDEVYAAVCSAKRCRAAATWAIVWNNPKLHTSDREKIWVACDEHKQPLADHLAVRSFLKRVEPLQGVCCDASSVNATNPVCSRPAACGQGLVP
jgi:hypothetical protein